MYVRCFYAHSAHGSRHAHASCFPFAPACDGRLSSRKPKPRVATPPPCRSAARTCSRRPVRRRGGTNMRRHTAFTARHAPPSPLSPFPSPLDPRKICPRRPVSGLCPLANGLAVAPHRLGTEHSLLPVSPVPNNACCPDGAGYRFHRGHDMSLSLCRRDTGSCHVHGLPREEPRAPERPHAHSGAPYAAHHTQPNTVPCRPAALLSSTQAHHVATRRARAGYAMCDRRVSITRLSQLSPFAPRAAPRRS